MDIIVVFGLAVGLAIDAFAIATVTSMNLSRITPRRVFRLVFHFGLFQALLPVLGWLAGKSLFALIEPIDHWVAFLILLSLGVHAIINGLKSDKEKIEGDATRGWQLVCLSLACSMDALAVGVSLAATTIDIWLPVLIIGLVTSAFTALGMYFGRLLGRHVSERLEIMSGVILILIGIRILSDHML